MAGEPTDVVLTRFVERYFEDEQAGEVRALDEYLALFPGHAEEIAREFLALHDETPDSDGSADDREGEAATFTVPEGWRRIGPYVAGPVLGRGGQGVVYEALDPRLGRRLALKVLEGLPVLSDANLHRFRREAEITARISHPGICAVYDADAAGGEPWIAMQFIEGESLARRLARARVAATPGPDSIYELQDTPALAKQVPDGEDGKPSATPQSRDEVLAAVLLIERCARALHAAHEEGLVHRDIKPGNIMVRPDGQPVLLDFGLARMEEGNLSTLTQSGELMGTPSYMSPEQLTRQAVQLDRRTDVYSLGVTLFECLTWQRPFQAATREQLYQAILTKEPPSSRTLNPIISRDLHIVIATCLQKDRDRRYQTAEDFAEDLRAVLDGRPIKARPVPLITRALLWTKREPTKAALLAVLLITLPTMATLVTQHLQNRDRLETQRMAELQERKEELLSKGFAADSLKARVRYFEGALALEGGCPEAVLGIAHSYLAFEEPEAALQALDRCAPALDGRPAAQLLRAAALRLMGDDQGALAVRESAPEPRDALDHYMLGVQLKRQMGDSPDHLDYTQALAALTNAILLSPAPRARFYHQRVRVAGMARDHAAFKATADALRALWPDSALTFESIGAALWSLDRFDEALLSFEEAVRRDPHTAHHHAHLGAALAMKGRLADAEVACRQAVQLEPDKPVALFNLAGVLTTRGALDEAVPLLRRAIDIEPRYADAHFQLGSALAAKGLAEEAIEAWWQALEASSDHPLAVTRLTHALREKGSPDEAVVRYRQILGFDPRDARAQLQLGHFLTGLGRTDESIACYRQAIKLSPGDVRAHIALSAALINVKRLEEALPVAWEAWRLDPRAPVVQANLGLLLIHRGRHEEGLQHLHEALRLGPGSSVAIQMGIALNKMGRFEEAAGHLRKYIELNLGDAHAHKVLGASLASVGLLDEASAECRKAIEFDPALADPHQTLAAILFRMDRFDEAIAEYREAIRLGPAPARSQSLAHTDLGLALMRKGLWDDAIREHVAAIRIDPGNGAAHANLLEAYQSAGNLDLEGQREELRRWAEVHPDDPEAWHDLAWGLLRLARVEEELWDAAGAVAAARKAVALSREKDPRMLYTLALVLQREGDAEQALAVARTALPLIDAQQPLDHELKQWIESLLRRLTQSRR